MAATAGFNTIYIIVGLLKSENVWRLRAKLFFCCPYQRLSIAIEVLHTTYRGKTGTASKSRLDQFSVSARQSRKSVSSNKGKENVKWYLFRLVKRWNIGWLFSVLPWKKEKKSLTTQFEWWEIHRESEVLGMKAFSCNQKMSFRREIEHRRCLKFHQSQVPYNQPTWVIVFTVILNPLCYVVNWVFARLNSYNLLNWKMENLIKA